MLDGSLSGCQGAFPARFSARFVGIMGGWELLGCGFGGVACDSSFGVCARVAPAGATGAWLGLGPEFGFRPEFGFGLGALFRLHLGPLGGVLRCDWHPQSWLMEGCLLHPQNWRCRLVGMFGVAGG